MRLEGRTALITGAAGGIGSATGLPVIVVGAEFAAAMPVS